LPFAEYIKISEKMPNEESYLDVSLRKIAKTLFLFRKKKTCAKRKIKDSFGKAFL